MVRLRIRIEDFVCLDKNQVSKGKEGSCDALLWMAAKFDVGKRHLFLHPEEFERQLVLR